MRKVTAIAATALVAAAIAVPTIAGAQEDATTSTTATEAPDTFRRGGGAKFETIASTIGITSDELRAQVAEGLTIAEIAEANGVGPDTVSAALTAQMQAHITDHLAAGDITQEQADVRLASVDERVNDLLNRALPLGGHRGAFGRDGDGMRGFGGRLAMSSTLPDLLDIDADELRTQLQAGSTIAEIAEANGVSVDDVINGLVGEASDRLGTAVTDGKISQEQADEALTKMTERITDMVNGEAPIGRGGFGGHERGRHGGHGDGFGPGNVEETVDA
ncbi:MAG: hypothetical protein OEY55_05290 [Acidimicrobiia bacterium]|nr:hypothetical protein [Acidimicrobiia bacterium]MDH5505118.1 hypothetical protein [Acidimicrobiia bacterium]